MKTCLGSLQEGTVFLEFSLKLRIRLPLAAPAVLVKKKLLGRCRGFCRPDPKGQCCGVCR
eukprot:5745027-Prorocentrum_lima.AAC.1